MAGKFNADLDTKILVHGWKSSTTSDSIQSIRGAYTMRGNLNIFGKFPCGKTKQTDSNGFT